MSVIEQHKHLEAIDRDIRRTMDVIGSVSQFAMLESNIQRNFVPISVVDLLEQTSRIFEFEACRKGVEIDLQIEPSIGTINAEKLLLRRAVENLISNALRFSPEGGIITVMAKRAGGLISLSVADTGLGISDEDLPRIFDFAFQGTDQRLPCVHGEMGVGLALVKKVAELHGGRVAAMNRVDRGAEFTLFLPIAPCALNAASPAQSVTHSSYTSH
ncbi:hypothetical protein GCM10011585_32860 [Edaphobacter dinghuensis]|uniref:histidine kinase n=2 Tax=Edaphobacter dinghuensis TaxID=1560005 RepID=A0A917M8Q9_9BACT|nr:hypothetical protein GCM10011585_32860 [Edaphobacter dinghuensis]